MVGSYASRLSVNLIKINISESIIHSYSPFTIYMQWFFTDIFITRRRSHMGVSALDNYGRAPSIFAEKHCIKLLSELKFNLKFALKQLGSKAISNCYSLSMFALPAQHFSLKDKILVVFGYLANDHGRNCSILVIFSHLKNKIKTSP